MFIYIITNDVNDKAYIGACKNLTRRWSVHRNRAKRGCEYSSALYRDMSELGATKFHITSIWSGDFTSLDPKANLEKLVTLEKYFIKSFQTKVPNGYNLTDGGKGLGSGLAEESRQRMSKTAKSYAVKHGGKRTGCFPTKEQRAKMSASAKRYCDTHPDEVKKRMKAMNAANLTKPWST